MKFRNKIYPAFLFPFSIFLFVYGSMLCDKITIFQIISFLRFYYEKKKNQYSAYLEPCHLNFFFLFFFYFRTVFTTDINREHSILKFFYLSQYLKTCLLYNAPKNKKN